MPRTSTPTTSTPSDDDGLFSYVEDITNAIIELDIIDLLERARWDMDLFAKDVLGIDAHSGQQALFELCLARLTDGYSPAYLTVCCSAGNRAGKTLGLAIVVAHQTLYKMGMPPPVFDDDSSYKNWNLAPYDWYHFGISQEVTELLHLELRRILSGVHEAQKGRGCPLTEALGEDVAEWDRKERGEWAWFKWSELLGGAEIHFRTTGEKALSTLGRDMNGWSWDEPAFDPNLTFIFDEVLNLRRMSTGGQAILIATATEGSVAYEELWLRGDLLAPDRQADYASLRMSSRQNVGYGISKMHFDRMLKTIPESLVPQNIDGYFIEARQTYFAKQSVMKAFGWDLPPKTAPLSGHRYAHGVDPAISYDSTWSIVLDITDPEQWVGVNAARRSGRQTAESIVGITSDVYHEYAAVGTIASGIDATGFGGKVFRSLLQSARVPVAAIEFGGKASVKQKMLANLRVALDSGRLYLPQEGDWLLLRRQMLGYKLADRKLDTDAVMALMVAVRMATRALYGDAKALTFDYFGENIPSRGLPRGVSSVAEAPRRYVDDRSTRLDTLATATVVPMSSMFKR
jgi:hypothetical protein